MSPSVKTVPLGRGGPQVVQIGLGLMGLSAFYGTPLPDEDRFKVLDRAYELGQTFWDSSDIYGDSEELVGAWFKRTNLRSKIFLATKFGIKSSANGSMSTNNSPEYVKEACAKSLSRLGTDYIDLYYCHRLDLKTPIEKTVQAMAELKAEGKIKYLGLSEVSSETLRRACKVHHISAVQVEYSPFAMDIESPQIDLLRTARELGVAIVAYSPLGRGFLTGQYKSWDQFEDGDFRKTLPRFNEENFPKNLELVESLTRIATSKGCTPGQLTLAWLMAQGDDIIPIPGTTKIKYLEENWGALQVSLSADEERTIRAEIQKAEVSGARYPQSMLRNLYADSPALD